MGIFRIRKNGDGPKFRIVDGKLITPEEYGFLSVGVSINSASESFEYLFIKNEHTCKMYFSELAVKDRFLTELAISSLFVSIYLHHMFWNLGVIDQTVFNRVAKGIDDGYKNVKSTDGKSVTPQLRKMLLMEACNYINSIKEDRRENATFNGSQSATSLLKNIVKIFANWLNKEDLVKLSEELEKSTAALLLKAYIDDDVLATTLAIESEYRIEFIVG